MHTLSEENPWVWVIVMESGEKDQILGQQDQEKELAFIPAFLDKEEALQALPHLTRNVNENNEIQAIRFNELARHARKSGFLLFILNREGNILQEIDPR